MPDAPPQSSSKLKTFLPPTAEHGGLVGDYSYSAVLREQGDLRLFFSGRNGFPGN